MRLRLGAQSIATRLFYAATLWSATLLLVAGVALSALYRRSNEQAFDDRLGVYLTAIVADVAAPRDDGRPGSGQLGEPNFELALSGWYWQITQLDVEKPEIRSSRSLFAARLPRLEAQGVAEGIGGARQGFAIGPDDRRLRIVERIIDAGDQGRYLVQVAASTEDMDYRLTSFNAALGFAFFALGLALVGTTALQVRFGLQPLRRLQDGVRAIRRGDSERIEEKLSPDLAPLAAELNLLLASNREIVERARTQVGNLAHALKTPLSVIVNEARAGEPADPLGLKVMEQATIMRDQVTYYLDRASAAARSRATGSAVEVKPALDGLIRTFGKIYRDRDILFEGHAPDGLRFRGEGQDLHDLIGNLVDNAGKWARARVSVEVAPETHAGDVGTFDITIDDDGPGLPAEERAEAVRRGRRLDETMPGSGLGLSIVVDLAAVYGGSLSLDHSPMGGLRAVLRLPAA